MECTARITPDLIWVGGNDRRLNLFENIFPIPRGISYNSYLLLDDKTVLVDTVDKAVSGVFFENLTAALGGRTLNYIVVNHMEPDHAATLAEACERYPGAQVMLTAKAAQMAAQFFGDSLRDRLHAVAESGELVTGRHRLRFFTAPMVHWPESMVSYEKKYKTLFSQDAFGSFGTLDGGIFDDELNWAYYEDEARRYFTNIVGKFYAQVRPALKKLSALDIKQIFPIHGPLHRSHPERILKCYEDWCNLKTEEGVVIVYGSMYGNTARAADVFARALAEEGIKNIRLFDVSKTHASFIQSEIWKYKGLVVASCTYNNGLFFPMVALCHILKANRLTNRVFATFGSYSWSGGALDALKTFGEECKYDMIDDFVEFKSAPTKEDLEHLREVAKKMAARIRETADEA